MPLGALKMTTQKFYRVSGDSTQYRGVVPDIVLPDRSKYNKFGERYLDNSLPWDAIPAVEHADWPAHVDMAQLRANSVTRVEADEDFNEIVRTSDVLAKRIENTRQSLNINAVYLERNDLQGDIASPHDGMDMLPNDDADEATAEGEDDLSDGEKLLQAVAEDPYTREAMAILDDFLAMELQVAESPPKK